MCAQVERMVNINNHVSFVVDILKAGGIVRLKGGVTIRRAPTSTTFPQFKWDQDGRSQIVGATRIKQLLVESFHPASSFYFYRRTEKSAEARVIVHKSEVEGSLTTDDDETVRRGN